MWISNSDIAGVFLVFANANISAVSKFLCIRLTRINRYNTWKNFCIFQIYMLLKLYFWLPGTSQERITLYSVFPTRKPKIILSIANSPRNPQISGILLDICIGMLKNGSYRSSKHDNIYTRVVSSLFAIFFYLKNFDSRNVYDFRNLLLLLLTKGVAHTRAGHPTR